MKTAVDSNILFDILTNDSHFALPARRALAAAAGGGSLVICPVVYAELATRFTASPSDLNSFLSRMGIILDAFDRASLQQGALAWRSYAAARGQVAQCAACGHTFTIPCPACHHMVRWRQHILPDFLIGGHAITQADRLLTRGRLYQSYFPRLTVDMVS